MRWLFIATASAIALVYYLGIDQEENDVPYSFPPGQPKEEKDVVYLK